MTTYAGKRGICARGSLSWEGIFDQTSRTKEIAELENRAAQPDFWEDGQEAQKTMQRVNHLRDILAPYNALAAQLDDLEVMGELVAEAGEEPDEATEAELAADLKRVTAGMDKLELETLLSGENDHADAIVEIKAGAGGTDACDWVAMLQKMYVRWAENHGYKVEIAEEVEAEVAGLKNVTFLVHGKNAYGYLRAEKGVHRLVRMSPFDAARRRQTSFASVDVMPDVGEEIKVEINPDDLRLDYYRSSGAGGQHVNKTDSAVRIVHLPTGITVTCQNERSQHKNKAMAMQVLQARLLEKERRENEERLAILRGENKANEWGNQDRSYVFHPYTLVKDLRTGHVKGDVIAMMNGEIDSFLQAFLQWDQGRKQGADSGA